MNLLVARVLCLLIAALMALTALYPALFVGFYLLIRPTIQPFGFLKYTLVPGVPLTSIFGMLIVAVLLMNLIGTRRVNLKVPGMLVIYLLLVATLLSFFDSIHLKQSMASWLKLLSSFAFFVLAYNAMKSEREVDKTLIMILLGSIPPMLYGFYQYVTGTGHAWKSHHYAGVRVDSTLGEYNSYGVFLGLIMCAWMMYGLRRGRKSMIAWSPLMVGLVVSFMISLNRGCWIGFAVGGGFATLFYLKRVRLRWILAAVVGVTVVFGPTMVDRFQDLSGDRPKTFDTFSQRVDLWEESVPLLEKRPLRGYGIGTYNLLAEKSFGRSMYLHNDYLNLAIEAGLPAAFLFTLFLLGTLVRGVYYALAGRVWHTTYPMIIASVFYMILSSVENMIFNQVNFPLFLTLYAIFLRENQFAARQALEDSPGNIETGGLGRHPYGALNA